MLSQFKWLFSLNLSFFEKFRFLFKKKKNCSYFLRKLYFQDLIDIAWLYCLIILRANYWPVAGIYILFFPSLSSNRKLEIIGFIVQIIFRYPIHFPSVQTEAKVTI